MVAAASPGSPSCSYNWQTSSVSLSPSRIIQPEPQNGTPLSIACWKSGYADPNVKVFENNSKVRDFAYHKVKVVSWQTAESDKPAIVTEPYEKASTAANLAKELEFYDSELVFRARVAANAANGMEKSVEIVLQSDDNAANNSKWPWASTQMPFPVE